MHYALHSHVLRKRDFDRGESWLTAMSYGAYFYRLYSLMLASVGQYYWRYPSQPKY